MQTVFHIIAFFSHLKHIENIVWPLAWPRFTKLTNVKPSSDKQPLQL